MTPNSLILPSGKLRPRGRKAARVRYCHSFLKYLPRDNHYFTPKATRAFPQGWTEVVVPSHRKNTKTKPQQAPHSRKTRDKSSGRVYSLNSGHPEGHSCSPLSSPTRALHSPATPENATLLSARPTRSEPAVQSAMAARAPALQLLPGRRVPR